MLPEWNRYPRSSRNTSGGASDILRPSPVLPSVPRASAVSVEAAPKSKNSAPYTPGNRATPNGNPIERKSVIGKRHSELNSQARVPAT